MTQDSNSTGDAQIKRPAPTLWAQRNQVVFLTFKLESCNNPQVMFESNKVLFSGQDHTTNAVFSNDLELYDEIKPEGCVWAKKGPGVECTLQKKENGFWSRLLKDKMKVHWLKVDFNKWQDEDEEEEEDGDDTKGPQSDYDLSQMMAQMGGGMAGGMPDMSGLGVEEEDSDDEDLPDLENAPDDGDVADEKA